jgi:hypothetical protein
MRRDLTEIYYKKSRGEKFFTPTFYIYILFKIHTIQSMPV